VSTIDAASRHDLTDAQWAVVEPLLSIGGGVPQRGRPRRWPLRGLIDGVRFRVRVGCPWRDVPDRYGPWWRVYALFACTETGLSAAFEVSTHELLVDPYRAGATRMSLLVCRSTVRPYRFSGS
jgi:transposase